MKTLTARMSLRLLLPVLLLCGLAALGDPLPVPAVQQIEPIGEVLLFNADKLLEQADARASRVANEALASGDAIPAASAMRLLITLPAFNRSCITACDG